MNSYEDTMKSALNKPVIDPSEYRFRIKNGINGCYIHETLFRIKEFRSREAALRYIRKRRLNQNIYYTEVVRK